MTTKSSKPDGKTWGTTVPGVKSLTESLVDYAAAADDPPAALAAIIAALINGVIVVERRAGQHIMNSKGGAR